MAQTAATIRRKIEAAKKRLVKAKDAFEQTMLDTHGIGLRPGDFTTRRKYDHPEVQAAYDLWAKRSHELAELFKQEDELILRR